jgi:hypothetical protein
MEEDLEINEPVSERDILKQLVTDISILRKKFNEKIYNYDLEQNAIKIIFTFATMVQASKARTYQGSWKKRGWQVSIFGNISRKFDRLEAIFTDPAQVVKFLDQYRSDSKEEPVVDTLIDMGVYCFLAASELMLSRPTMFDDWLKRNINHTTIKDNENV